MAPEPAPSCITVFFPADKCILCDEGTIKVKVFCEKLTISVCPIPTRSTGRTLGISVKDVGFLFKKSDYMCKALTENFMLNGI